jgi:hypothetical protein
MNADLATLTVEGLRLIAQVTEMLTKAHEGKVDPSDALAHVTVMAANHDAWFKDAASAIDKKLQGG